RQDHVYEGGRIHAHSNMIASSGCIRRDRRYLCMAKKASQKTTRKPSARKRVPARSSRVPVTHVTKPWGFEKIWARSDRYMGKILHINAGHELSVQYHN